MNTIDDFIKRIIATEVQECAKEINEHEVVFTNKFTVLYYPIKKNEPSVLKISPIMKVLPVIGLCFFLLFIVQYVTNASNFDIGKILLTLLLVVIFSVFSRKLWLYLTNVENFYPIVLSSTTLMLQNKGFDWQDIWFTAILYEKDDESTTQYLLIGLKNGTSYEKIPLNGFETHKFINFETKLANYIEHYKNNASCH